MAHPFDRYAAWTDLEQLMAFSHRPLRKSIRVNTLKTNIERFKEQAAEKQWQLEAVPWSPEGFYIDRELRESALGKDLLHLLGHMYMQEAASMLPVELLDPQPGETVLDMSAAPGSKTTQVADKLKGNGVIIANDVQEKRLWTLKTALHRSGVLNVIVTKKVGQWFSKNMTERFHRVLCDAPCTAQGTIRKDSDALQYCSLENIGKMAKLQKELLESAVDACHVGGRIVYSTCTLAPEENEEVVRWILQKFPDQLEAIDPLSSLLEKAVSDSLIVQKALNFKETFPAYRLWPQTYDTEGFFCTVLHKKAPTRAVAHQPTVRFQEEFLPRSRQREVGAQLEEIYGTSFLREGDQLLERGDLLLLASTKATDFRLPVQDYSMGMPFAKRLKDGRLRLEHEIATLRGYSATQNVMQLTEDQLKLLLDGKDTTCDSELLGDTILRYGDLNIGIGLAKEGILKNRLPRWVVVKS